MSKPIDQHSFWKERIDNATVEHYSVYICPESTWEDINKCHLETMQEHLKGKILDAGCGYGRWSQHFDDYVGVDFSPDFIELAKKKYPGKTFLQADLRELPFYDKEFDWAVCVSIRNMIIGNMGNEEWKKMEDELRRVSKNILLLEYTHPEEIWIL